MTFFYIIKTLILKWINTVSKTGIATDLLVHEIPAMATSKRRKELTDNDCCSQT